MTLPAVVYCTVAPRGGDQVGAHLAAAEIEWDLALPHRVCLVCLSLWLGLLGVLNSGVFLSSDRSWDKSCRGEIFLVLHRHTDLFDYNKVNIGGKIVYRWIKRCWTSLKDVKIYALLFWSIWRLYFKLVNFLRVNIQAFINWYMYAFKLKLFIFIITNSQLTLSQIYQILWYWYCDNIEGWLLVFWQNTTMRILMNHHQ